MPFQSDKQRRYLWANEPEIAKRWERDYANGGIASQGGMNNYMGQQPMVNAPQQWQSGPDAPSTELAYITQPEKNLILKSNIHGSLQNGPNEGPSGIMSLDGQGDYTPDRSPAGRAGRSRQGQAQHEQALREVLTGQVDRGQTAKVSDKVRRGAVPEWVERPDGTMAHVGSAYKDTGRRGFLSKLFGGANKYGYGQTYGTGSGRFFDRKPNYGLIGSPGRQRYVATDPRIGQVKPGYGGRILGGLASLATGIPFVGSAIGSAIDKYKPKSYWDKLPDSEKRRLNALNITPYNEQKISIQNDVPMDSLSLQNFSKDPLTRKLSAQNYDYGSTPFDLSQGEIMNTPIDNSMYGGDQDIYGVENARGLFRPSQQSTDFNTKYGPEGITYYDNDNARDFPLKGTFDKDAWEYNQPEEWQNQEFPVRQDFLPQEKMTSSITQTGKPMINDEWRWNRW